MYTYQCSHCGKQFATQNQVARVRCPYCGTEMSVAYGTQPHYAMGGQSAGNVGLFEAGPSGKSRGIAGLLAILLGTFGIHYFYLGKTGAGIIFLILGLLSCGILGLVTVIQGILMIVMTQDDFEKKYVYTTNSVPLF